MFSKMAVLFIMGTSRKMIIIKNQAIDMHVQVIMVWYQCSLGEVLCSLRNRCGMLEIFFEYYQPNIGRKKRGIRPKSGRNLGEKREFELEDIG